MPGCSGKARVSVCSHVLRFSPSPRQVNGGPAAKSPVAAAGKHLQPPSPCMRHREQACGHSILCFLRRTFWMAPESTGHTFGALRARSPWVPALNLQKHLPPPAACTLSCQPAGRSPRAEGSPLAGFTWSYFHANVTAYTRLVSRNKGLCWLSSLKLLTLR